MLGRAYKDNAVDLKLSIIKVRLPGSPDMTATVKQFNQKLVEEDIGPYMEVKPFFEITEQEIFDAKKSIDTWFREFYKGNEEIMENYDLKEEYPFHITEMESEILKFKSLRVYWDVLVKANQNKMCSYAVLKEPLPAHPDIDLNIWTGCKVLSPFRTEMNEMYNIINLKGSMSNIDRFLKTYGV